MPCLAMPYHPAEPRVLVAGTAWYLETGGDEVAVAVGGSARLQ